MERAELEHPDEDALWWERFFDSQLRRDLKTMDDCCDDWMLGHDATRNRDPYRRPNV